MYKLNLTIRALLTSSFFLALIGFSGLNSFGTESIEEMASSYSARVYPTRIALTLCTHLADTISLNDDTSSKAYNTLIGFNRTIKNVLTDNKGEEIWLKEFNLKVPEVLSTLQTISDNNAFSVRSKLVSSTIEPELRNLWKEASHLESTAALKNLLQIEAPSIAVKEFLERNTNIKQRPTKCDDCGLGYFRQHKSSKGNITLECQLCHHHQSPTLKLSVKSFVRATSSSDSSSLSSVDCVKVQ